MATFWLMVASVASVTVRDDDLDWSVRITAEDATHDKVDSFADCITGLLGSGQSRKAMGEEVIKKCPDHGKIFGALAKGIQDAGFLKDWKLIPTDDAATIEDTLTLSLSVPMIYGEIASASKVPIMWKISDGMTIRLESGENPGETMAHTEGLEYIPPKEGIELYKKAMTEDERCTAAELAAYNSEFEKAKSVKEQLALFKKSCIAREKEKAYDLFNEYYGSVVKRTLLPDLNRKKKEGFGESTSRGNSTSGKITSILSQISSGGVSGIWEWIPEDKWPTVFYTMIVGGPAKITRMSFATKGVRCWIENPADWEGAAYGIYEKDNSVALVGMFDAMSSLKIAETAARSGMAFGEMVAWGKYEHTLEKIGFPHMASVDALMNMFSYCDAGVTRLLASLSGTEIPSGKSTQPPVDPTCKGSTIGRVSWGDEPGARFT